jgi:hypothetical protein
VFRRALGRRLDREREAERRAAFGAPLGPEAAAMQRHDRAADGKAQADAAGRALGGAAMEFRKQLSGIPGGRPGPESSIERRSSSPKRSARRTTVVPGGVYLAAFSSRLANTCSMSVASTRTSGRSPGISTRNACDAKRSRNRRSTVPAISVGACQSRSSAIAPASSRVISSTLATSSPICCDCSKTLRASAPLLRAQEVSVRKSFSIRSFIATILRRGDRSVTGSSCLLERCARCT